MIKRLHTIPFLLLLFFGNSLIFAQKTLSQYWIPDPSSDHHIIRVLGQDQQKNLWFIARNGHLISRSPAGIWDEADIPVPHDEHAIQGIITPENIFYLSIIDQSYQTRFLKGHPDSRWHLYSYSHPEPVRNWFSHPTNSDSVYAAGDFGILIQLRGHALDTLRLPQSEHITSAVMADDNSQYLGVRNNGLLHRNELSSSLLPAPKLAGSSDIVAIETPRIRNNSHPDFLLQSGYLFSWSAKDKIYQQRAGPPESMTISTAIWSDDHNLYVPGNNGKVWVLHPEESHWRPIQLPTSHRIVDSFNSSTEGIIFIDARGVVFTQRTSGTTYFTQFPQLHTLTGNSYNRSQSAQVIDINRDFQPDIIINNQNSRRNIQLLIKQADGTYIDETARYFENIPEQINYVLAKDLNNDLHPDLITMTTQYDHTKIETHIMVNDRFHPYSTITIDRDDLQQLRTFQWLDHNNDSYPDLMLGFYYGDGRHKGGITILTNNGYGRFTQSHHKELFPRTWISTLLFTDINADDIPDLYLGNYWKPDVILDGSSNRFTDTLHIFDIPTNTTHIMAGDLNSDGRHELIRTSMEFGVQIFHLKSDTVQETQQWFGETVFNIHGITRSDLNQDYFDDLIIHGDSAQQPFITFLYGSDNGLKRSSSTQGLIVQRYNQLFTHDLDEDGDYDIIGLRDGENVLFQNHLNPTLGHLLKGLDGFIKQTHWPRPLMTHDSLPLSDYTVFTSSPESYNSTRTYKGISNDSLHSAAFDLTFNERIHSSTTTPSHQITSWVPVADQVFWLNTIRVHSDFLLRQAYFYFYITAFLLASLIITVTYRIGHNTLGWTWNTLSLITFSNFLIFGVLLLISLPVESFWRYLLPVGGVLVGSVLPIAFSLQYQYLIRSADRSEPDELFDMLMQFVHGAWSSSVINRLQMLLANYSDESSGSELRKQINERRATFINVVRPDLQRIAQLLESHGFQPGFIEQFQGLLHDLERHLQETSQPYDIVYTNASQVSLKLERLQKHLRSIKEQVWLSYSSNLMEVVQQVTDLYQEELSDRTITLSRTIDSIKTPHVLMPAPSVGRMIDNLLQNALKTIEGQSNGTISINIFYKAPKWHLAFSDSGRGIHPDHQPVIFEAGFSTHDSTGQGLYQSRQLLKKFGGRIYIQHTSPEHGTTFIIEFLEGISQS